MKTSIPAIVVLVLAILAGSVLARNIRTYQDRVTVSRSQLAASPLAGFHKLVSDIKWMQFIQYCGSQDKVDASNADIINDKLQFLVRLDPDFVKAYETGALMLAVENPDKAVGLLRLAIDNGALKGNWRLPFLAGFIKMRQVKGDTAADKECLKAAIGYFDIALKRGRSEADYVLGSKLHAQSLLERGERPLLQAELETWYAYYQRLFSVNEAAGPDGAMTNPDMSFDAGPDRNRVALRILALAQACNTELKDNAAVMTAVRAIMGKLESEFHLCRACFHSYGPGDKYCAACGDKVQTYGACSHCGFVTSTAHCTQCGTACVAPAAAITAVAKPAAARAQKAENPQSQ